MIIWKYDTFEKIVYGKSTNTDIYFNWPTFTSSTWKQEILKVLKY